MSARFLSSSVRDCGSVGLSSPVPDSVAQYASPYPEVELGCTADWARRSAALTTVRVVLGPLVAASEAPRAIKKFKKI